MEGTHVQSDGESTVGADIDDEVVQDIFAGSNGDLVQIPNAILEKHLDNYSNGPSTSSNIQVIDHFSDVVIDQLVQDLIGDSFGDLVAIPNAVVEKELANCSNGPSTSCDIQVGGKATPITFASQTESRNDFFNLDSYTDEFRINTVPENVSPMEWVESAFREVYTRMKNNITQDVHRVIFKFNAEGMQKPAYCNVLPDFSFEQLWEHVSSICQSTRAYEALNDLFTIEYSLFKKSRGGCAPEGFDEYRRECTYKINNDDNLCLPRSLVIALYAAKKNTTGKSTKEEKHQWDHILDGRRMYQGTKALELSIAAGVEVPENGCGRDELIKYQDYLARQENTAIMVYACHSSREEPTKFYDGIERVKELRYELKYVVYIAYYVEFQHYEPIYCIHRFINKNNRKWCMMCQKGFQRVSHHKCPAKCSRCFNNRVCEVEQLVKCKDCRRSFAGIDCYNHHKEDASYHGKQSVCLALQICRVCGTLIIEGKTHHCGKNWCSICGKYREAGHLCFMKKIGTSGKKENSISRRKCDRKKCEAFVCYDFEARQDEELVKNGKALKLHIPNYYVAQITCEVCANLSDNDICEMDKRLGNSRSPCYVCPVREYRYHGDDAVDHFLGVIQNLKKFYSKVVCIAHNAKSYDGQFLLRSVMKQKIPNVETILTGSNIMLMAYDNVKFIDSLNYIQMPLASFPKTFGLSGLSKGYFPHFFNTRLNQNYVGVIPPKETFGIRPMKEEENEEFDKWYNAKVQENYIFDFKKELEKYCVQDVIILRRSVMLFRSLIMKVGKICPFSSCVTIASTCMRIFQVNYLKADQIGIIPKNGYRLSENQSRIGIEWLMWMEKSQNIRIQHAGRQREYVLNGIKLDGFHIDDNGQRYAYQFQGCYWHGCVKCFPDNRDEPRKDGRTLATRYCDTQARNDQITGYGVRLIQKWECEFINEKKENASLRNFVNSIDTQVFIPLNPRDAFFGGRTGNTVTLYETQPGEQIHYDDVCSLYPYVLKTGSFPVGHPKVYLGDSIHELCPANDISNIEGLIKCRVLPPQNLFHAVLPVRANKKLFFPLCRTCLEDEVQVNCPHKLVSEREFLGTWTSIELKLAVEKGYKILFISEIWQYETVKYDPNTGEDGIFASYIDTFLKIKQEASGWPSECIDDLTKNRYIEEYARVEGIRLDPNKIEKNAGLRAVAKLALNCLWGKFAQRDNLTKTSIIQSPEEWNKITINHDNEIKSIIIINPTTVLLNWKNIHEAEDISPKTNAVIAAFTTAHARKKLYSYLDKKKEQVLYFDTDSVIYRCNGGNDRLKLGNFLGDLTDELEKHGKGSYIKWFASGGPKFYCYIVQKPDGSTKECCKLKGVRLDVENRKTINFESIRKLIDGTQQPFILNFNSIRRTKEHEVVTREEKKTIRVTGPKRRFDTPTTTLPYGYIKKRKM